MGKRLITLTKPIQFEGKEHKTVDLSGLDDLKAIDLIDAQRMLQSQGVHTTLPECDYSYCFFLAARVTKLPLEFYLALPGAEGTRIRGMVSNFLFGEG